MQTRVFVRDQSIWLLAVRVNMEIPQSGVAIVTQPSIAKDY